MSQTQAHFVDSGFPLDGLKLWHLLQTQISGETLKVNSINFDGRNLDGNIHPPHNVQQEVTLYNEEQRMKMNQAQIHHHHHHHHQDSKIPCNCPMCPPDKKNNVMKPPLDPPHINQIHAHSHQVLHQQPKQAHSHVQHHPPTTSTNLNCTVCHKKIRNSKKQQQQQQNHPNHLPMCDKCSKSQKSLYTQNNLHGNTQNNNNNNNSNAQNSVYSHSTHNNNNHGDYERHQKASRGDCGKQFSCGKCSKGFSNGGNLKRHLMIHSGEKPFSCQVCNKSFRSKTLLENHLRTHTGEKPFLCNLCDKKFSKSENLKRHVKIHVKSM